MTPLRHALSAEAYLCDQAGGIPTLRRDLDQLANQRFDCLIIGAGIFGACAAWEATRIGLRVALIDKGDFGAATSANSLRILHGGLRPLSRFDLRGFRLSATEQRHWRQLAPQLVRPLRCVMPLERGARDAIAFRALFALERILRPHRPDVEHQRGRVISAAEAQRLLPGLEPSDRDAALWHELQLIDGERLTLALVAQAAAAGAVVANYVEAEELRVSRGRAGGADVRDQLAGRSFAVDAGMILLAVGPGLPSWADRLSLSPLRRLRFVTATNIVVPNVWENAAVGFRFAATDPRVQGLLFVVPWRDRSIVGTVYSPTPDDSERDVALLLDALAAIDSRRNIGRDDIHLIHRGLVPMNAGGRVTASDLLLDSEQAEGLAGVVVACTAKYTTARALAERAVHLVAARLGRRVQNRSLPIAPLSVTRADSDNLAANVRRAVDDEMAVHLEDVILRRMSAGSVGYPGDALIKDCAQQMATAFDWDDARQRGEIDAVHDFYRRQGVASRDPQPRDSGVVR